jgi:cell filamentation protein
MTNRYLAQGPEAEFEPGSHGRVLLNLLGVRSAREMARIESEALLSVQEQLIEQFTEDHRFSAADIRRIHHVWLGHIYPWAGEYRSVNISKGNFHFAVADQVPRLMQEFEGRELTRYTPCRFESHEQIAEALAVVHAEFVLIHPFREGNGRCARLVALLMGLQAGLPPLDFGNLSGKGKQVYIGAIHAALDRSYAAMTDLFRKMIRRTLKHHGISSDPRPRR